MSDTADNVMGLKTDGIWGCYIILSACDWLYQGAFPSPSPTSSCITVFADAVGFVSGRTSKTYRHIAHIRFFRRWAFWWNTKIAIATRSTASTRLLHRATSWPSIWTTQLSPSMMTPGFSEQDPGSRSTSSSSRRRRKESAASSKGKKQVPNQNFEIWLF